MEIKKMQNTVIAEIAKTQEGIATKQKTYC
jgi:hypothetical protein